MELLLLPKELSVLLLLEEEGPLLVAAAEGGEAVGVDGAEDAEDGEELGADAG